MGVAIPTQSDARKIQGKTVTAPTALDDGKALVFDFSDDKYKHGDARLITYTNPDFPAIQTVADALDYIFGATQPITVDNAFMFGSGDFVTFGDGSTIQLGG